MSMEYCHKHNRHFDTDYEVECAECEQEFENAQDEVESRVDRVCEVIAEEIAEPTTTCELIRNTDIEGAWPNLWTLASKSVSDEAARHFTMPERDHGKWLVVYQSTDAFGVMAKALEFNRDARHFAYAVGIPAQDWDWQRPRSKEEDV